MQRIYPTFVTGEKLEKFKESLKVQNVLIMKLIDRYWSEKKAMNLKKKQGSELLLASKSKSEDDFLEQLNHSMEERVDKLRKELKREMFSSRGRVASIEEEDENEEEEQQEQPRGGSYC